MNYTRSCKCAQERETRIEGKRFCAAVNLFILSRRVLLQFSGSGLSEENIHILTAEALRAKLLWSGVEKCFSASSAAAALLFNLAYISL